MRDDYWEIWYRCEKCGWVYPRVTEKTSITYEGLVGTFSMTPNPGFQHCEKCRMMTLQTMIGYPERPE